MIRQAAVKLLSWMGWLAAAYSGYWLSQLAKAMAASGTASLRGVSLFWLVTPWQVQTLPLNRGDDASQLWLGWQWSLAVSVDLALLTGAFLLARRISQSGDHANVGMVRLVVLLAGLWVSASRLWEVGRYQLDGTGRGLRQLSDQLSGALQTVFFPVVLLIATLIIVVLGVGVLTGLLARRTDDPGSSLGRLLGGAFPVFLAVAGQTAIAARVPQRFGQGGGTDWALGGPLFVAAILIFLNAVRRRAGVPFWPSARQAAVATGLASVLAASLASAERILLWQREASLAVVRTSHYEILYDSGHWSQARAEAFAAEREVRFSGFGKRVPWPDESTRLRVVVYSDFRALRRSARGFNFQEPSPRFEGTTARAVAQGNDLPFSLADDARLYLAGAWGEARSPLIATWAARWLVGKWQSRPLRDWAGRLSSEGERLSLAELVEESQRDGLPPSQGEPVGGAWIESVVERASIDALRQLYKSAPERITLAELSAVLGSSPGKIEKQWQEWIASATLQSRPWPGPRSGDSRFLRGMTLKPTELPAAVVERELLRLDQLGTDAVALITHEHYRGGTGIQYHPNTAASDERLTLAIRSAQRLGMRVLLKPQVYGGGEGFAGNICIEDGAARALWMESYRKFILHYARMAQDEGVALFSVGNELGCLTKHVADWRKLIAAVRRVYSSPLTYAANWGEEFETIRFWDALDFIGLNNYYPLTESPGQEPDIMRSRAQEVAQKVARIHERWQRPVLFTEAGFPSLRGGTFRPWDPPSRVQDVAEQAAGYDAIIQANGDQPWLHGVFWWAWYDGDLSPAGKPAEQVLSKWYRRLAEVGH